MSSTKTVSLNPSSAATAWRRSGAIAPPSRNTPSALPAEPSGADEHPQDVELGRHRPVPCRGAQPGDPLERELAHRVGDLARVDHRHDLVERHPPDAQVLGRVGRRLAVGQPGREVEHAGLVGDRVRQVERRRSRATPRPRSRSPRGARAGRPSSRSSSGRDAALGDLPGVAIERVAVLADEDDPVLVVDRDDADGPGPEVDDAVDARLAVGPGDLVVVDLDPGVLVGEAATAAAPRADGRRRVRGGHGSMVAARHRGDGAMVSRDATPVSRGAEPALDEPPPLDSRRCPPSRGPPRSRATTWTAGSTSGSRRATASS